MSVRSLFFLFLEFTCSLWMAMTCFWTLSTASSKLAQTWVKHLSISPVKPRSHNVKRIRLRLGNHVSISRWRILGRSCWVLKQNVTGFKLLNPTTLPHLYNNSDYLFKKKKWIIKLEKKKKSMVSSFPEVTTGGGVLRTQQLKQLLWRRGGGLWGQVVSQGWGWGQMRFHL